MLDLGISTIKRWVCECCNGRKGGYLTFSSGLGMSSSTLVCTVYTVIYLTLVEIDYSLSHGSYHSYCRHNMNEIQ